MASFPKKLSHKLEVREAQNALRVLPIKENLKDFASNDYLGFAKNTIIFEDASKLLSDKNYKQNGATGSRLLSGNYNLYIELETFVAKFQNVESALVFNSGYDANVGFFSAVPQRGDIILYDEYIHASIRDGITLSNAKAFKFKHNNLEDLKKVIQRVQSEKNGEIYIVTESVFSMDGDSPDLNAFADFCSKSNYHFVVDEAHAIGVFGASGQGLLYDLGLQNQVFAQIITFGKAMGCHGAAILGSQKLKEYLVNFARSFIYTTGLPPHSIATILTVYKALATEELSRQKLLKNITYFNNELISMGLETHFIPSISAIHCCLISGNEKVKAIANQIQSKGFDVKAILSPTVPGGQERLRFCLHSYNSSAEISDLMGILKKKLL